MSEIIEEALDFFRLCEEAETTNRANAIQDIRFRYGEQWPVEKQQLHSPPRTDHPR